eukprot:gb/GFBE01005840.1/.p1 GENE.gb/GFBE01005840.1/~~gb/GFBE01005840.1/.p1  ORF type:complete len:295 (+),score=52.85 gb/GFBE01005840.1/:1-885(+)
MGRLASESQQTGNGHADVVCCLQKIYAKGKSGFGSDSTSENIDPQNLQYGEVTYQGMEPLYDALDLGKDDVFYDLGCGVGKLVLYVALRGEASRSVGLEVGERRHILAECACKHLRGELELQSTGGEAELPKLEAPCAKYSVLLADISRHRYSDPTVVVLTNLCMDMGVQSRTLACLLRCRSFRRLVSITPLLPHARLKLVRSVMVCCSWAKVSAWQVYDVLPPQEPLARSILVSTPSKRSVSTPALRCTGSSFLPSLRHDKKEVEQPPSSAQRRNVSLARLVKRKPAAVAAAS